MVLLRYEESSPKLTTREGMRYKEKRAIMIPLLDLARLRSHAMPKKEIKGSKAGPKNFNHDYITVFRKITLGSFWGEICSCRKSNWANTSNPRSRQTNS